MATVNSTGDLDGRLTTPPEPRNYVDLDHELVVIPGLICLTARFHLNDSGTANGSGMKVPPARS